MKAFLTSGRLTPAQIEKFKELLGQPRVNKALFITTAAVPYGFTPIPKWLDDSLNDMGQFAEVVHETSLEPNSFIPSDLNQYGFIFVSGGNSFYLAYRLQYTGIASKIRNFIEQGGVYSGSSAGALILMDNIENFAPADNPEAAPGVYSGLSIIDFAVVPHADHQKYKTIIEGIANAYRTGGKKVVSLNDDQVLVIDGQLEEVI